MVGLQRRSDLLAVRQMEGYLSRRKAALLYDTICDLKGPGDLAEVGSWKGKSTSAIGMAMRRSDIKGKLYAIDHHVGSEEHKKIIEAEGSTWDSFERTVGKAGVSDLIQPLRMKSVPGAGWLRDHKIQLKFLYLDGAHDEDSVREDLLAFIPLLLPGAIVALDDAIPDGAFPGVHRAYSECLKPFATEIGWAKSLTVVRFNGSST